MCRVLLGELVEGADRTPGSTVQRLCPMNEAHMSSFTRRATELQRGVKHDEARSLEHLADDYSDAQVRQATVHTRQDVVLLVSLLSALNVQVRRLVWIALAGLLLAVARILGLW